ncbi:PDDEXK-like family protein [Sinomicrobium oceani]|uniref:PDDEXK-like family protein n=1 Tax=Sinomicrobium oceani TaxID=1150368 RepID=UPI00227BABDD|nr:PD-(D/E)XK nuclease family protein [Sinomicrobium oceani]
MTLISSYTKILKSTSTILKHQHELAILKGETFNLFSILDLETKENKTHSAFLGELLNPNGSHHQGNTFLKLFLKIVKIENHLDVSTTSLCLEYHLGERNITNETGGRIDIYLKDHLGKSVCIENKLYAPDQDKQIARYYNHNKRNNKVYYLTLEGTPPSEESRGNKKKDTDFTCISYKEDVLEWLSLCVKEVSEFPIIRESIRQYIILIKKLTGQLTNQFMEKEMERLIATNYSAASIIAKNIEDVELKYATIFLNEIKENIEKEIDANEWEVSIDEDLKEAWTGLRMRYSSWPDNVWIKLEGSSKVPWNYSILGIVANESKFDRAQITSILEITGIKTDYPKKTKVWPAYRKITEFDFGNIEGRTLLFQNQERKKIAEGIAKQFVSLANSCTKFTEYLNKP